MLFCGWLLADVALAETTPSQDAWRVWFEAKSMRAPVTAEIPGAERTQLAAGFLTEEGLSYFSKAQFAALKVDRNGFAATARTTAAADLQGLKPRYERNGKKVIEFAELTSERPIVASAVLAPKFLALFKDTLGPKLLVAIPNRYTAYVFPALSGNHRDYWPMVFNAFRGTGHPVSVEIFEISAEGVRAVGVYEEP